MKAVVTSAQMKRADQYTISHLGVSGETLMERAASACVASLKDQLTQKDQVAVVCGAGNNGGDGFAVARILTERGFNCHVFLTAASTEVRGDAALHFARLKQAGCSLSQVHGEWVLADEFTWIVDALFGTGLNGPVRETYIPLIASINRHPARVLAVDLPSGLCADHGEIVGDHVKADLTVTFAALKFAHVVSPACQWCGKVEVHDIGISFAGTESPNAFALTASDYQRPARPLSSHKGSFGSLAIIGGFQGMEGAANLAAKAALRFGAGKVRVLTERPDSPRFHSDSVMTGRPLETSGYNALVVGPGLSRSDDARSLVNQLAMPDQRVVWDADGLALLDERDDWGREWVITPHPGEAAQILGTSNRAVQAQRLNALAGLRQKHPSAWIVLKGYRTLISDPAGTLFVCLAGNPALATAGSGDVLSGMIGALFADPSLSTGDAVVLSCLRHAMAADYWIENHPDYSMLAEDIIDDLTRTT